MTLASLTRLQSAAALSTLLASCAWVVALPSTAIAQPAAGSGGAHAAGQDPQLVKQVEDLRAQVMRLQAALEQKSSMAAPAPAPVPAMPMDDDMGEMSAMPPAVPMTAMPPTAMAPAAPMAAMPLAAPGGMAMGDMGMMGMMEMMGMPPKDMNMPAGMMMGEMGMGGMKGGSAMPPAPAAAAAAPAPATMPPSGGMNMGGAPPMPAATARTSTSSLYHVGASGFFLDQPQLTLTSAQTSALNGIKARVAVERADSQSRIETAEQELWALTGADQPDTARIQAKAQEIEQARTAQRIEFIQAVAEATGLLTPEQRRQVQGT